MPSSANPVFGLRYPRLRARFQRLGFSKGIAMILVSTLAFSVMKLAVKYINQLQPELPSHEIVFFRSILTGSITLVFLWRAGVFPLGNNRTALVFRGIFGTLNLLLFFETIRHIPLAVAATLQYLSPIFTALVAALWYRHPIRPVQYALFTLAFGGVALVEGSALTSGGPLPLAYVLMGVLSAVMSGLAYNVVGSLKNSEHPLVIVLYFPLMSLPIVAPLTLWHGVWPTGWQVWALLVVVGLSTQLGQYCMTRALLLEDVNRVSPFLYFGVVYAWLYGIFLFDEWLNLTALAGIAIIVGSVLANLWLKQPPRTRH